MLNIFKQRIKSSEDELTYLKRSGFKFYRQNDILYKYVDLNTAKLILKNHSLKFSKPDEFNDPFELSLDHFDYSFSKKDLKKFIDLHYSNKSLKEKERIFEINKTKLSDFRLALADQMNTIRNNLGICCFSNNSNNALMWSHYADKHNGLCLGFKFQPADYFFIMYVKYIKAIKKLKIWDSEGKIIINWAFTKSHLWKYEEEIRAVYMKQNGIFHYNHDCLEEIYYGLRTNKDEIENIEQILKINNYKISKRFKMEIYPKYFNLIAKEF